MCKPKFSLIAREEGQSAIVVAVALIVLVALVALVVDAGNAYAERRKVQNAVDAGAQAGAVQLSLRRTNLQVYGAIEDYVRRNGVDPARIQAYYVTEDTNKNPIVEYDKTIEDYALTEGNLKAPTMINGRPVVGVSVQADKSFPTFFAGVVGFRTMQVAGGSPAYAKGGACYGDGLFPIAFDVRTFTDVNEDGTVDERDVIYYDDDPTHRYRIWDKSSNKPSGNFGWLSWNGDPSNTTLIYNMQHPENSGTWYVGDNVPGAQGVMESSGVRSTLDSYISSGTPVNIPIYDTTSGSGNNATYHIIAFARFRMVGYNSQGNDKYIDGVFLRWVHPNAQGGCPNYGVSTTKSHLPPPELTRALIGTVMISKLTVTGSFYQQNVHVPVDVMHVLDISGSMNGAFGGRTKLQAAKEALTNFNSNLQPDLGDKVGLVTFPRIQSGSRYRYTCTQNGYTSNYYFGQTRHNLTSNVSQVNNTINNLTANGGTPIGDALRLGRLAVTGAGHNPANPAVIILASDGIANIRTNGLWTGFSGNTYDNVACNQPAVQDAIDQANIAKSDQNGDGRPDVIIFSIAVGNDFNPDSLRAIASVDTDPSKPHYFRVTDASSMRSIYEQIANRIENIADEECSVIQTQAFAPGASVVIRNQDTGQTYNVQTSSTGEFVIDNVQPGTFVVQSASVTVGGFTYDIFTDGLGGPPLGSSPTIQVGQGSGSYKVNLFLMTDDPIRCE